jgi:release factor glutamine methyltransferase
VTRREAAWFDRMLDQRASGMPLQYALGVWGFRTLELLVDHRVLIPRPETEVVVDCALAELDRARDDDPASSLVAVDLGTGSGAIALSLATERRRVLVWASDRSTAALDVARSNLVGLGIDATRVRLVDGAWYGALPADLAGTLALIVSNPPYVAAGDELPDEVRRWEPTEALVSGPTGLEALEAIVDEAPGWLRPGGALVVELAPHQAATVAAAMVARGLSDVGIKRDLTGRDRVAIGRRAPPVGR